METTGTNAAVQRCLDALGRSGDGPPPPALVRELLAAAAEPLHLLCAALLRRAYPRLTRPPLNLRSEEVLGAVVERLLKALARTRPEGVRQFFALARQHMRWELNDVARQLDECATPLALREDMAAGAPPAASGASGGGEILRRLLAAIEGLPPAEREVFELVRLQGLTHPEAAATLGVATKTVQRRLQRGVLRLSEGLAELRERPHRTPRGAPALR